MMKNKTVFISEKTSLADPVYYHTLSVACCIFLFITLYVYTRALYEQFFVIPCMLFLGALLERNKGQNYRKVFILPGAMVAWFLFLQIKRGFAHTQLDSIGLFLTIYLFAFPLATLLPNKNKKKVLKRFAGTYVAAASVLSIYSFLLILDCLPAFLSNFIYWNGARLNVLWHPNISAIIFMIAIVFCVTFLSQAQSRKAKLGFSLLLIVLLGTLALTNCRTAIILTGCYLGVTLFFVVIKHGRKWFSLAALAMLVLPVVLYLGAGFLYQGNQDSLTAKYIQQTSEQSDYEKTKGTTENTEVQDISEGITVDSDEVKIDPMMEAPQGSIIQDFGTLNSRIHIWKAAYLAIRDMPSILYWGLPDPGAYVSHYNVATIAHLHNAWLQCLVGLGIIGFLIAALFTVITFWNSLVILLKYYQDIWKRNVALLSLCLMAASVLEPYLFYTTVDQYIPNFLFFLCAGYLNHWQEDDNHYLITIIRSKIPFLKK